MSDETEQFPEEELTKVLEACVDILQGVWGTVTQDDLIVSKCSGGIANRVYLVQLSSDLIPKVGTEPVQVIVRLYGSAILENIDEPRLLGDDAEIIIFHLLSEYGLGPRLLGVFSKGRIEEFISHQRPDPDRLKSPAINKAMATIFARIHSLDLPVTRKHVFYQTLFHGLMAERIRNEGEFVIQYNEELTRMADEIDSFPFDDQLAWLDTTSKAIEAKSVFCHNDLHLYNILFRDQNHSHETHGTSNHLNRKVSNSNGDYDLWLAKMIPIDFELGSYGWRGYDLAYYLNFRYYHPCEGEIESEKIKFPDHKEILIFVKDYLSCLSDCDPNFDPVVDNIEQVMKEVELASLYTHLFLFGWSIKDRLIESKLEWPKAYPYLRYKMYLNERDRFIEKYGVPG